MHKKLSRLIEPNLQPYFLCLALFAAVSAPIQPVLAGVEVIALAALYIFHRRQSRRRRRTETGPAGRQGTGRSYSSFSFSVAHLTTVYLS